MPLPLRIVMAVFFLFKSLQGAAFVVTEPATALFVIPVVCGMWWLALSRKVLD